MNAKNWKVGMSSCSTGSISRETFEKYAEAKIDCLEISLSSDKYPTIDWKAAKRDSAETGVEIRSLHLPFSPFQTNNIASKDNAVRRSTIEMQSEYIKRAGEIGIGIAVIHPSGEPNPDSERVELLKYACDSLSVLAETAAGAGVTIAVEDLPRTCLGNCSNDIKTLISADDRLRVCFDTNHLLIERNVDFIRAVGKRFITLHVSDYDFRNERHWLPYEGKNDWIAIVSALEEVGYAGPWMYEVGLSAPNSIKRRELTCSDFRKNYEACTAKLKPEILGVPVMEVCDANVYFKSPVIEK